MRITTALLSLVFLLSKPTIINSRSTKRDDDDDDDDNDNGEQDTRDDAMRLAEQLSGDSGAQPVIDVGPVSSSDVGPSQPSNVAQQEAAPAKDLTVSMPHVVGMPTALNRFGKSEKHHAAATGAAKPVKLALKRKRFGHQEDGDGKESNKGVQESKAELGGEEKEQSEETEDTEETKEQQVVKVVKEAEGSKELPQAEADAKNAHIAAQSAKQAAKVATKVAEHTSHVTKQASSALKDAQQALHEARIGSKHLSKNQRKSLKEAEKKLKEASKAKDTSSKQVKTTKSVSIKSEQDKAVKKQMKAEMEKIKMEEMKRRDGELEEMRKEIEALRKELKDKEEDKADDDAMLKDLQDEIGRMEEEEKKEDKTDKKSHDEMKAEIERLKGQIEDMDNKVVQSESGLQSGGKQEEASVTKTKEVEKYDVNMKPLSEEEDSDEQEASNEVTPVQEKGIDIDTAMPYGDLEPFGREDTAQELTEDSIKQSDEMVDQLEKAEVSEEKRAVFRALTRLRGAAITSFDGVARSQTGNIDEYNKIHKWRETHPLHHLADEESDISKWAFPDNAD